MEQIKINLQSIRISFENGLWALLFNDPWFQDHESEMREYYFKNFPVDRKELKNQFREIPSGKKEVKILERLHEQLGIHGNQILVFSNPDPEEQKIECRFHGNTSVFIISDRIRKYLLEREIEPLLAHELGHYTFLPPFQVPIEYLLLKYIENDSPEEQNNILRLLYLSYKLIAIVEFNADRLALFLYGFETMASAYMQLCRLKNKRSLQVNFEALFRNFPLHREANNGSLIYDYLSLRSRLYTMFLFSHEHNLIDSENLRNIKPRITLYDHFNPPHIIETYYKIFDTHNYPEYIHQLRHELLPGQNLKDKTSENNENTSTS